MRDFIFLAFMILLAVVQAASAAPVEAKPLAATPTAAFIPKPNPNSVGYTAPYPKFVTERNSVPIPAEPQRQSNTSLEVERRIFETSIRRGAVSTAEFLGQNKKGRFNVPEKVITTNVIENSGSTMVTSVEPKPGYPVEGDVIRQALDLPPEQITEGKYRTFKQIENDGLYDTRKIRSSIAAYIFPELKKVGQTPPKIAKPVYCYKSLSDATCYLEPIEGQEFRRIGKLQE